jgi:streptomycin 6-kinase
MPAWPDSRSAGSLKLDSRASGWLAIDPKGLLGDRGFDYANIFCNPDEADADPMPVATLPDLFAARVALVAELADLERSRLLLWILAWDVLSAVWTIEDGGTYGDGLDIATMAATELDL